MSQGKNQSVLSEAVNRQTSVNWQDTSGGDQATYTRTHNSLDNTALNQRQSVKLLF